MQATITSVQGAAERLERAAEPQTEGAKAGANRRGLILCSWDRALMIHYAIDPALLRPFVPLELDTRAGLAYVSLVAFEMSAMRTGGLGRFFERVRLFPRHRFLNLRTYVRDDNEPGIFFLSEWVSNRLAVALGPLLYGLPYRNGRLQYLHDRPHEGLTGTVAAHGALAYRATLDRSEFHPCPRGSLDEFLMERYVAFTHRNGVVRRFEVSHDPWPQTQATVFVADETLLLRAADWFKHARLVGANYSPGVSDVLIGPPTRVAPRAIHTGLAWLPLVVMTLFAIALQNHVPPWLFMWTLAGALFFGCKLRTLADARVLPLGRTLAYLFAWVGMDARKFLDPSDVPAPPMRRELISPLFKIIAGATLVLASPAVAAESVYLATWLGMIGLILCLHFGAFHLLALLWRRLGVNASPIMRRPAASTSLGEFWGRRWNTGFRCLSHEFVFRPVVRAWDTPLGAAIAALAAFLVSGLLHDLVVSLPARGGYGLPTAYFLLQGLALLFERSPLGKSLGLGRGIPGRLFVALLTLAPIGLLFHEPFVTRVARPMFHAIGLF